MDADKLVAVHRSNSPEATLLDPSVRKEFSSQCMAVPIDNAEEKGD
jgi:hypothetical protein